MRRFRNFLTRRNFLTGISSSRHYSTSQFRHVRKFRNLLNTGISSMPEFPQTTTIAIPAREEIPESPQHQNFLNTRISSTPEFPQATTITIPAREEIPESPHTGISSIPKFPQHQNFLNLPQSPFEEFPNIFKNYPIPLHFHFCTRRATSGRGARPDRSVARPVGAGDLSDDSCGPVVCSTGSR